MYEAGELTVAQIAAEFGVTRPTIYRHLGRLDQLDAVRGDSLGGVERQWRRPSGTALWNRMTMRDLPLGRALIAAGPIGVQDTGEV
jgi:AcrR family transcriptional regulator